MSQRRQNKNAPATGGIGVETPASPAGKARGPRWRRFLMGAGLLFVVYVLAGFFVLPPIIKSQMLKRLPALTHREVSVRKVQLNPLALSFRLEGLSLSETNGDVFVSLEELYVNFQASSLLRWAWTFDELRLRRPYGHVIWREDGRFNFENLIPEPKPEPESEREAESKGAIPAVLVRHFHIQEAAVALDDFTHRLPLHAELKPINVSFTNLTTRPEGDTPYTIAVSSDTFRSLAWKGELQVDPFVFQGSFVFEEGRLGRSTPVVRDYARTEITDGRLDARLEFRVAYETNGLSAVVTNSMVQLTGLKVKDLNTDQVVSALEFVRVAPIEVSLADRTAHVGEIRVEGFSQVVRIAEDGSLNFNALLDPAAPAAGVAETNAPMAEPAAPWTISLGALSLDNSVISFTDLSRDEPFQTSLGPIRLQLTDFSTRPEHEGSYDFSIVTESGERISGAGLVSIAPTVRSRGKIRLEGLHVPKYEPYYGPFLRGRITEGLIHVESDYAAALAAEGPSVTATNAKFAVEALQVRTLEPDESVFRLASLAVTGTRARWPQQTVDVGLVRSSGGRIHARQNADGTINLLGLLPEPPPAAEKTDGDELNAAWTGDENTSAPDARPWDIAVREVDFQDYALTFEDRKPARPARLDLDRLRFNLQNITLKSNAPIAVVFSTHVDGTGGVSAQGEVEIFPPRAEMTVEVRDLELSAIQPYLEDHARVTLAQGRLQTRGRVRFAAPPPSGAGTEPILSFAGDVGMTDFLTRDQVQGHEMVQWEALRLQGVEATLPPDAIRVEEIRWEGLHTSVIIDPMQQINLLTVVPSETVSGKNQAAASKESPERGSGEKAETAPVSDLPSVEVGALVLDRMSFKFLDQSIRPACVFVVEELGGTVRGLTSRADGVAQVDLNGNVSEGAPFSVRGQMRPLAPELSLDVAVAFTNTDLTAFTPYLEKYAGHPMRKGKLSMALGYEVQGDALSAQNRFQVAQLTLGPRNDSPDATALPVRLAVALLKDRRGNIELDVPLSGKLSDPQFAILPLVTKTILNLIARAATSPFSLLASVLGGDTAGEELSFVAFVPGQAEIPPAEAEKLDQLIRALYERPGVNLEIEGQVDLARDKTALAEARLAEQVESFRRLESSRPADPATNAPSLLSPPRGEDGWPAAYFFRCAETNLALLPETNLVAMLSATNTVAESGAPARTEKGGVDSGVASVSSPDLGRTRRAYFSSRKGAALLRGAPLYAGGDADSKRRTARGDEADDAESGPPAPEDVAARLGLTDAEMKSRLAQEIPVPEEELRDLVRRRAKAVESHLIRSEKIERQRLMVVSPAASEPVGDATTQSRVKFSLN